MATPSPPSRRRREREWDDCPAIPASAPSRSEASETSPQASKRRRLSTFPLTIPGFSAIPWSATISATASKIVDTAADAIVFTAALGLASYRFWYGTAENENNSQYGSNQSTTEGHAFQGTAKPIDCQGEQQELPPPYESVYEGVTNSPSPFSATARRRPPPSTSPHAQRRFHIARMPPRRRVALPASPASAYASQATSPSLSFHTPPTDHSTFSSPIPQADFDEGEDAEDVSFLNMSARLQELIRQGNDALRSPAKLDGPDFADQQNSGTTGFGESKLFRRGTMGSGIPVRSVDGPKKQGRATHRSRLSLG